jgi:putative membrane-bound dehydrogenase-like protein
MLSGSPIRAADLVPSTPSLPTPAAEAAGRMTLPPGFRATLFAAEPDIVQPIAFTIDPRGRLWVVECYSYPLWQGGPSGKDRILIFEDTDGDGKHDRRTVFYEGGTNFTGIELGFGGVWVCATPNLLFIPDRDGDDKPDGAPEIRLDGWSTDARHNLFNALKWGPDGWLWGCNGILSESKVGVPGTADADRVPINCGVWRYHPTRKVFEAVAHGTTNPWGLDFDDLGEAFITNCVIPHLFHVVPGAHFQRMFGPDMNPYSYGLMETCADHLHWAGGRWQDSRSGASHGEAGGGHAHVGAMVYLGDNWPDKYRNSAFMCNIHGHRVNHDSLERKQSGYVARHQPDFLKSSDPWFRGMELKYGPDGGVYLTDWSDVGECHENDADGAHRENGRIFKIVYGDIKKADNPLDLSKLSDVKLAELQLHKNEWYVRTARLILQGRAAAGKTPADAHPVLREILRTNPDVTRRLRALWALNVSRGIDRAGLMALLDDKDESIRSWAIRLLVDQMPVADPKELAQELFFMASGDKSAKVRLALASALQRLPVADRWLIAEDLVGHAEDATDRALSLMTWYGIEPLVGANQMRSLLLLAGGSKIPLVGQYVARRAVAANPKGALAILSAMLQNPETSDEERRDLLAGILEGVRGMKRVAAPAGWGETSQTLAKSADAEVRERALLLDLDLGEPRAIASLREVVKDRARPLGNRQRALASLAERRTPGLVAELLPLLDERGSDLRGRAIRALAGYPDAAIPEAILAHYARLSAPEREDAIGTLITRREWAGALLEAVRSRTVSKLDLTPAVVRQIQAFNDAKLTAALDALHADVTSTAKNKASLIAKYKGLLASNDHPPADAGRGRGVFSRLCLQCHRMFDAGGDVGPDLTGSDRANADYILENVLDPSATVGRDFTVSTIATTDGRLISGILREQSPASVTIQTTTERIVIPREDIEQYKPSNVSMMPEGQLERLTPEEIRDLFSYLGAKKQVAMPGK